MQMIMIRMSYPPRKNPIKIGPKTVGVFWQKTLFLAKNMMIMMMTIMMVMFNSVLYYLSPPSACRLSTCPLSVAGTATTRDRISGSDEDQDQDDDYNGDGDDDYFNYAGDIKCNMCES